MRQSTSLNIDCFPWAFPFQLVVCDLLGNYEKWKKLRISEYLVGSVNRSVPRAACLNVILPRHLTYIPHKLRMEEQSLGKYHGACTQSTNNKVVLVVHCPGICRPSIYPVSRAIQLRSLNWLPHDSVQIWSGGISL